MKLKFYGGAGDYEKGELGGVQILIDDKTFFDFGQRPDHYSMYYGFPYKPKNFAALGISQFLEFYPDLNEIYRYDYKGGGGGEYKIVLSHPHFDHAGGINFVDPSVEIHWSKLTKLMLWLWQYTSGKTINQFVDFYDQFTAVNNLNEGRKFLQHEEGMIPRKNKCFTEEEEFDVNGLRFTGYKVDHSVPGSCGFIVEKEGVKLGISGDLRRRGWNPKDTDNYIQRLLEKNITHLLIEGSLLHFEHQGSEKEVADELSRLCRGYGLVMVAYPPRDFSRILSVYKAARASDRMLVVNAVQAIGLSYLDGVEGFPRINWKHIGVFLPRKNKGVIDVPAFEDLAERDYFGYERWILEQKKWDGNKTGVQRVGVDDLKNHSGNFILFSPANMLPELLEETRSRNARYIRMHPAPWTKDMEVQEDRIVNLLDSFNVDIGPKKDLFNGDERRICQLHVTGHFNRGELRGILKNFNCTVIPYHCMDPRDFVNDAAKHTKVIVPQLREEIWL